MVTEQIQTEIFARSELVLDLPGADVVYWPEFISSNTAWALYQHILDDTQLRQETITVYGKQHLTPRLSCWMADVGLDYQYSNHKMIPTPWSSLLFELKQQLEGACSESFNSVLINYYRDGQDSNGWHADDEPELGPTPVIASLSLGASRDFDMRNKANKHLKHRIKLEHGSLLIMRGTTQRYWQHHIPKRANAEGRLNLTFRKIIR